MRFRITCKACGESFVVRGHNEEDVNALILDERDLRWNDACEHVNAGGDYDIGEGEYDDDDPY
jgi:hypothetical protein